MNFGFDSPFVELWGEFELHGNLISVILRYRESFLFYSPYEEYDIDGFCNIILNLPFKVLSGKKSVVEFFSSKIPFKRKEETWLSKLDSDSSNINQYLLTDEDLKKVKLMNKENMDYAKIEKIAYLYQSIDEFLLLSTVEQFVEQLNQDVMSGSSRIYYIEEDGMIVSTARTGAEVSDMAKVLGVCTLAGYRNKGYATLCMKRLCSDLIAEGKSLCLCGDNPKAANIYRKIGFEQIGTWVTLGL